MTWYYQAEKWLIQFINSPPFSSLSIDLGSTNTYRYVNAANVYSKGKQDATIGVNIVHNRVADEFKKSSGVTGLTTNKYYALSINWIATSTSAKATISSGATTIANCIGNYSGWAGSTNTYVVNQLLIIKTTATTVKFSFPNASSAADWVTCGYAELKTL